MTTPLIDICPCKECICVGICKNKPHTSDVLNECSLARQFYFDGHPYRFWNRFVVLRSAFNFNPVSKESNEDWQHLLNQHSTGVLKRL